MTQLNEKKCRPCVAGTPALKADQLLELQAQLPDGWAVVEEHHLQKLFEFEDFRQALDFTNRVAAVAEAEGHHPTIILAWGRVELNVWTHKIDGLTESDFIFAAKADAER